MRDNNKYKSVNIDNGDQQADEINIREGLEKYGYYWKWFLLGVIIALATAFVYLRYATYQYEVSSTILINDTENGGGITSELSAFQDLGLIAGSKSSLETEMGVLKSRTLMERVIKELGLQLSYYAKSRIGIDEVYQKEMPFNINLFVNDSILHRLNTTFTLTARSTTQFILADVNGDEVKECVFGETIKFKFGDVVVTPKNINNVNIGQEIIVEIKPVETVAIGYKNRIEISQESKKSGLLVITLKDPVINKAKAILDNLVSQYNRDAIQDKIQIAESTETFINNRIDDISVELTNLDLGVQTYKIENRLTDMASEAGIVLQSNAELDNQIVNLTSQIKLIDYVIDYMKTNKDDLIPANLGMLNENTSQNALDYNRLLLERNRLLKGANENNPTVINLNDRIVPLRQSIEQSLLNERSSLSISLNEVRIREAELSSIMYSAPKKEREIRDIQRQQQIIETLYLYLLQKREENSITLASTAPNAKVIDRAYGNNYPVSPNKRIIYLGAFLLGLIVPFIIIFVSMYLDNKIHTFEELEKIVKAPILGDIPSAKSEKVVVISGQDNSNVAEAFRLLRTNVNFMLPGIAKEGKTIFITSTISGEGKTFIAINLASALTLLHKKVLLIGADIRKPKIATYLKVKQEKGLSLFLIDNSLKVSDVIVHHDKTNLDIIHSGIIPPNPSELLTNGRFDEIMSYARANYDFVVVDTAPANVVTDTLLLSHHADLFLYVVRANFLDKRLLKISNMIYENNRLPYMSILINDTNYEKRGYGYGYGYGEQKVKKSWLKRIFTS
ncbi:GumC family protein [Lutimonas vermicola]|uniref:non-specific protein-tyrosine kinase n=1 Tax=Lutimonas vermicola TaxID=414288 RepID=A0ABU9L5J2_9FLAO